MALHVFISFNDGAVVAIFQYLIELMLTPGPSLGPRSQFPRFALLATFFYTVSVGAEAVFL
jgi:hypothetical protein